MKDERNANIHALVILVPVKLEKVVVKVKVGRLKGVGWDGKDVSNEQKKKRRERNGNHLVDCALLYVTVLLILVP